MKIIKQQEFPLLNFKTLTLHIEYPKSVTPKNETLTKEIASFVKAKEDLVVIKNIYPKFGDTEAEVIADIYHDESSLKKNKLVTRKSRRDSKKAWLEKKKGKEGVKKEEVKEDGKKEASKKQETK